MNESYGEPEPAVGGKPHQEDDDNLVLWVGNLDSRTTENMVYELFCQAGPILHIRLPKNPDGQGHKGYSFVTFQHEASVPYAINVMEGTTLFGKKLKLQPRPGSVHRKLMDQKKVSDNFQGPGQPPMQSPPPAAAVPQQQQQQQWFAHPQMAQVPPNMFVYQNQLYQSYPPTPNMNMNLMAIPYQPAAAAGQMTTPFVQIPVQPQQAASPPGSMLTPQQQASVIRGQNSYAGPRMQNGFNGQYISPGVVSPPPQQQQLRAASPQQSGNSSHYNNSPMNGQGQGQQYQPRGHYQNHRGIRPQRNGGYSNGSAANNNSRMPYHQQQQQQQRLSNAVQQQQQQPYMINAYQGQGQTVQLVQSPDFRRGNPPQQQQTFPPGTTQGQTYPTAAVTNGYHVYHY